MIGRQTHGSEKGMAPCGHSEALVTGAEQTARGGWPGSWNEGVPSGWADHPRPLTRAH